MLVRRSPSLFFCLGLLVGALLVIWLKDANLPHFGSNSSFVSNLRYSIKSRKGEALLHHQDHDLDKGVNDEQQQLLVFDHEHDEGELAKQMKKSVRIFCWIMTAKKNTWSKAVAVNATWASRCNKHVFITAEASSGLPIVDVGLAEGRELLWGKTKRAFEHIYKHELENFDWFLKADDDTYVVLENLRFLLLAHSPTDPVYFGCKFKPFVKQGYMSGGSGYVLSREAVKRLVEESIPHPSKCKKSDSGAEDAELGKCLANVGVLAGDSRDSQGRHRMLPFSPLSHFESNGSMPDWFTKYMYYPYKQGSECCSDHMISFHYVNRATLFAIHNLLYHIRPFGLAQMVEEGSGGGIVANPAVLLESAKILSRAESVSNKGHGEKSQTKK